MNLPSYQKDAVPPPKAKFDDGFMDLLYARRQDIGALGFIEVASKMDEGVFAVD